MKKALLFITLIALSCTPNTDTDDTYEIEQFFRATVNGVPFEGSFEEGSGFLESTAILQSRSGKELLQIYSGAFDENTFPYLKSILFNIRYDSVTTTYQVNNVYDDDIENNTGSIAFEQDWDGLIAVYFGIDPDETMTLIKEELETGEVIVRGEFKMTMVVDPNYKNSTLRRLPDTLHVENGEYRLLLDDRRD
jgi:hypothetical protein